MKACVQVFGPVRAIGADECKALDAENKKEQRIPDETLIEVRMFGVPGAANTIYIFVLSRAQR